MKKKHRKSIHRMNKLLVLVMGIMKDKKPCDACAVCTAVIAIMYNRMSDEGREIMAPTIVDCLAAIVEDQKKMRAGERVH